MYIFFFKQKTAYEMRISDWSSDVCSSDLSRSKEIGRTNDSPARPSFCQRIRLLRSSSPLIETMTSFSASIGSGSVNLTPPCERSHRSTLITRLPTLRSEEHTSELQSLMRISYAVFCLKKKTKTNQHKK